MGQPVAWIMVEPGWRVLDTADSEVGRIEAVLGDEEADIFNGLAVVIGGLSPTRYVPAERVRSIEEGSVTLDLSSDEVRELPRHESPAPSIRVLPE
jgi:hypothetical protein